MQKVLTTTFVVVQEAKVEVHDLRGCENVLKWSTISNREEGKFEVWLPSVKLVSLTPSLTVGDENPGGSDLESLRLAFEPLLPSLSQDNIYQRKSTFLSYCTWSGCECMLQDVIDAIRRLTCASTSPSAHPRFSTHSISIAAPVSSASFQSARWLICTLYPVHPLSLFINMSRTLVASAALAILQILLTPSV
jgi:hypothetical protein